MIPIEEHLFCVSFGFGHFGEDDEVEDVRDVVDQVICPSHLKMKVPLMWPSRAGLFGDIWH